MAKKLRFAFWILQKKSKFCQSSSAPGKLYLTNTALAKAGAASGLAQGGKSPDTPGILDSRDSLDTCLSLEMSYPFTMGI